MAGFTTRIFNKGQEKIVFNYYTTGTRYNHRLLRCYYCYFHKWQQ